MLNNNRQNSDCAFAEPLISYFYGEIGVAEKAEYEAHLKNCAACESELAAFGFARTAIQEWKIKEFDVLPTPAFEIPLNTAQTLSTADNSVSWIENFKRFFSFRPALAMSALAILIAFAGVALFFVGFKEITQIAGKTDKNNPAVTEVSPTVSKAIEQPKRIDDKIKIGIEEKFAAPSVVQTRNLPVPVSDKKISAPLQPALKVPADKLKNNSLHGSPLPDIKAVNNPNVKSPPNRKSKLPSLTEAEDVEDNSVRLADLFDEIDTK